jgi:hypothetical protein
VVLLFQEFVENVVILLRAVGWMIACTKKNNLIMSAQKTSRVDQLEKKITVDWERDY